LVVATTYDPATPYRGAKNLIRDLGNARLLTQRGDGHTAYPAPRRASTRPSRRRERRHVARAGPGRTQDGLPAPVAAVQSLAAPQIAGPQPRPHVRPLVALH
jgi:hypothetical protein